MFPVGLAILFVLYGLVVLAHGTVTHWKKDSDLARISNVGMIVGAVGSVVFAVCWGWPS